MIIIFQPAPMLAAPPPSFSNAYSLLFGGVNQYVDVAAAGDVFSLTDKVTVCCWLKADVSIPFYFSPTILGYDKNGDENQGFGLNWLSDNSLKWRVEIWNTYAVRAVADPYIWNHFCGVYDGTAIKIYINGVTSVAQDGALSGNITTTDSIFAVGRMSPFTSVSKYMVGNIDEVAVWNVALAAAEVTTLYNGGVPLNIAVSGPQTSALKLYWRMGDGDTYPTISDHSGVGNTGTMQNMTSGNIVLDVP